MIVKADHTRSTSLRGSEFACLCLQAWVDEVPSAAVDAGATVCEDERPSYAMHWRNLQEFYRVRSRPPRP